MCVVPQGHSRLRYLLGMEQTSTPNLSPSERLTLRHVAEGDWHMGDLDWVAVQRLKQLGLWRSAA
jgi:hypothetical protein